MAFFENEQYGKLVDALVALKACPFSGKVTADQVKITLGEYGDIWPASIADDEAL